MPIRIVENFRALFYAPFYAAATAGAFARAGVDVHILPCPDPARAGAALRQGEAEAMWGGPLRVLLAAQDDPRPELVCFCDVVARDPFLLVGATPRPDFRLADLAGLRLATVSEVPTPWLCLQDDLRRAGVDPAALRRTPERSMEENAAALRRGEADAVQLFEPLAETLLREGFHLWHAAAARGPTAYTTLVTRRPLLRERAEELRAVVAAMAATLDWMAQADARDIAGAVLPWFPGLDASVAAAALDRYRCLDLWAASPVMQPEGLARLQEAMMSAGLLRAPVPFGACVDNTLALRAT